jgi:hypothetical protein
MHIHALQILHKALLEQVMHSSEFFLTLCEYSKHKSTYCWESKNVSKQTLWTKLQLRLTNLTKSSFHSLI